MKIYLPLLIVFSQLVHAQDLFIDSQDRFLGANNPCFYGFGNSSKAGILYNSKNTTMRSNIEYRSGFANHFFSDNNFSLAIDVSQMDVNSLGYNEKQFNLHYVYNSDLSYEWVLNTSISASYNSSSIDYSSLIFEDQIDIITGSIVGISQDPINIRSKVNYFDAGAGVLVHNNSS